MQGRIASLLVFAVALAAGLWLRLQQILDQVVADDEWHGLAAVAQERAGQIFGQFGFADRCIPLTLFYKLCAETIGLDELVIRVPPLAGGIITLILLPWLARPLLGAYGSSVFALLLAGSPLLVLYGRVARGYAFAPLLCAIAFVALLRWRAAPSLRYAIAYVAASALAIWTLVPAAPCAFVPLLAICLLQRDGPSVRRVVLLGAAAGAATLALIGVPLVNDLAALQHKASKSTLQAATIAGVLNLFSGSPLAVPKVLWLQGLAVGAFLLARRAPFVALALGLTTALQVAAIALTGAEGVHLPIVFARYALPLLPAALLLVSMALVATEGWLLLRARWLPRGVLPLAAASGLFFAGPLPWMTVVPNQFSHHAFLHYAPEALFKPDPVLSTLRTVPAAYHFLAQAPACSLTIAEIPWQYDYMWNTYLHYQLLHRQRVVVGVVNDLADTYSLAFPPRDRRVHWRHIAYVSDLDGMQARGVRYLLVHKDLGHEQRAMQLPRGPDLGRVIEFLRGALGPPVHDDGGVETYDLLRRRR